MNKSLTPCKSSIIHILIISALFIILVDRVGTVLAADFSVSDAAELNNAIIDANNEIDNPGADTIFLASDIVLTGTLTSIASEITIEGNGYTLDGGLNYRILDIDSGGNLTVNFLTIAHGLAENGGGAGILNAGLLTVYNSTFSDNSATTTNPFGGAVYNNNGTVTINNSTFSNNIAGSGGAIRNNGTMTINNSTISGNSAGSGYGGGITNNSGRSLTLNNTTITNNSAGSGSGGGIRNDGTTNINRCIVSGNSASTSAAEISNNSGAIINSNNFSIFAHSGLSNSQAFGNFTPGSENDYNATSDANNTHLSSILFTTLSNNGGPTSTHALPSSSPAIDLAPSADCNMTSVNGIDQRGAARNFDGNDLVTGECDTGAYEFREIINVGDCAGSALDGPQTIFFTSGYSVTINIDSSDVINCISVEEMGTNHLMATGPGTNDYALHTGNWWHISGNINSGFIVDTTLFYPDADENSRVCKWPSNLGENIWDCGNDADNTTDRGNVTRTGITSFSDWAVGDNVGPTAISLSELNTQKSQPLVIAIVVLASICFGGVIALTKIKSKKS